MMMLAFSFPLVFLFLMGGESFLIYKEQWNNEDLQLLLGPVYSVQVKSECFLKLLVIHSSFQKHLLPTSFPLVAMPGIFKGMM